MGDTYFVYYFTPEKLWEINAEKWFRHKNPKKKLQVEFQF